MQRLDALRFALAGGIYGAGCVALATICSLLDVPGFKPFTDLLLQFYGLLRIFRFKRRDRGRSVLGPHRRICPLRYFRLALQPAFGRR
jgi:hypothetical protein